MWWNQNYARELEDTIEGFSLSLGPNAFRDRTQFFLPTLVRVPFGQDVLVEILPVLTQAVRIKTDVRIRCVHNAPCADLIFALFQVGPCHILDVGFLPCSWKFRE
jgi:hypothetical protein